MGHPGRPGGSPGSGQKPDGVYEFEVSGAEDGECAPCWRFHINVCLKMIFCPAGNLFFDGQNAVCQQELAAAWFSQKASRDIDKIRINQE